MLFFVDFLSNIFSLENDEIKDFIILIRDLEIAFGKYDRILHDEEKIKRDSVRRSAHLLKEVKKGEKITVEDIALKRPGTGLYAREIENILNKKLRYDLSKDHILSWADIY